MLVVIGVGVAGYLVWPRVGNETATMAAGDLGTPFATRTVNGLTVNFYSPRGGVGMGDNEILIEFRDAAKNDPVDVGTVRFNLSMNMPGMPMQAGGTISPAGAPGRYRAKIESDMAGDWTAKLHYEGPRGSGDVSLSVNVKS